MRPQPALLASFMVAVLAPWTPLARAAEAVPQPAAAETRLTVDPPLFSPNGDGRLDTATITVRTELPTSVRIEVVDAAGSVRRSWTAAAASDAPASVTWDGRDDAGAIVEGPSTIRTADAGPARLANETAIGVTADVRAPSFRWRGMRRGSRFRFAAHDDAAPMRVTVEVTDDAGTVATIEREIGAGRTSLRWSSRRLFPGNYAASVTIADAVGNIRTAGPYPWRVERSMRGRVWHRVERAGPRVALTIDDCHEEGAWSSMLQTLEERRAGATFFCPGEMIAAHPELARRTIRAAMPSDRTAGITRC